MLHIGHFGGADKIKHFCLRLDHVGRDPAAICDGIVYARFFNNMFVEEVGASGHQRYGIKGAASQMRGIRGMCCDPFKAP